MSAATCKTLATRFKMWTIGRKTFAQTSPQGTNSETVSYGGFRPQIHPPTTTLHVKLITMAQLNGFFKEVHLMNGNPPAPFCGCTENVRCSRSLLSRSLIIFRI